MTADTLSLETRPRRSGKKILFVLLVLVAIFFTILMVARAKLQRPPRSLPVIAQVADVPLINASGERTSLTALNGRIRMIQLHARQCGEICEEQTRQMQQIHYYNTAVAEHVLQMTVVEGPMTPEELARREQAAKASGHWRWFAAEPADFTRLKAQLLPDASVDLATLDELGRLRVRYLTTKKPDRRELMLDSRALVRELKTARADH